MISRIQHRLLRFFHDHRRAAPFRALGSAARSLAYAYEHPGYQLHFNGEEGLLRTLRNANLDFAIDVGANHGEWIECLLRHHPAACVHAFELAAPTFAQLATTCGHLPNVTLHPHGLGSSPADLSFHYYPSQDGLTSAVWHMHERPSQILTGRVERGDARLAALGLNAADFLKIDVEGMELDVLRGFGSYIQNAAFRFIQFEHHGGRALLHDFYNILPSKYYVIGKLYSRYVAFTPYHQELENGIGPNFLAVRIDQREWIERLSAGWRN